MFERVGDETLDFLVANLFGWPLRKFLIPQLIGRRRNRWSLGFLPVVGIVGRNDTTFLVRERRHCLNHITMLGEGMGQSIESRNLVVIVYWFVNDHVSEVLRYGSYPEYVGCGGGAID